MKIKLIHNHFNHEHFEMVATEMLKRGNPVIRCIWSECHGVWQAIEGCHRLRVAHHFGITPIIKDVSNQKTVNIEVDGEVKTIKVETLLEQCNDDYNATVLSFD